MKNLEKLLASLLEEDVSEKVFDMVLEEYMPEIADSDKENAEPEGDKPLSGKQATKEDSQEANEVGSSASDVAKTSEVVNNVDVGDVSGVKVNTDQANDDQTATTAPSDKPDAKPEGDIAVSGKKVSDTEATEAKELEAKADEGENAKQTSDTSTATPINNPEVKPDGSSQVAGKKVSGANSNEDAESLEESFDAVLDLIKKAKLHENVDVKVKVNDKEVANTATIGENTEEKPVETPEEKPEEEKKEEKPEEEKKEEKPEEEEKEEKPEEEEKEEKPEEIDVNINVNITSDETKETKEILEDYKSTKELLNLNEDYFKNASVVKITPEIKLEKLSEEMVFVLAKNAKDPNYEKLVAVNKVAKALMESMEKKYLQEAKTKAKTVADAIGKKKAQLQELTEAEQKEDPSTSVRFLSKIVGLMPVNKINELYKKVFSSDKEADKKERKEKVSKLRSFLSQNYKKNEKEVLVATKKIKAEIDKKKDLKESVTAVGLLAGMGVSAVYMILTRLFMGIR